MVHKRRPAAGDSPAAAWFWERFGVANINRQIAEELGVREQQIDGDGGTARRRRHGAVRGALSQGNHRRARRRATAHAGRAPDLFARTRRAPGRDPQFGPRTRQARRRAGSCDHGRRQQGASGRHLSAVQAEAPHQGRDCQGSRARAVGRIAADAAAERSAGRRPPASSMPRSRWRMLPRRSKARARSWWSALPRMPI